MNKEEIKALYLRAEQYAITKYKDKPWHIEITSDGDIDLVYDVGCCGSTELEYYTVSPEELTRDLEDVARERREKEEEDRIQAELQRKKRQEEQERLKLEEEKRTYYRLKKKFES